MHDPSTHNTIIIIQVFSQLKHHFDHLQIMTKQEDSELVLDIISWICLGGMIIYQYGYFIYYFQYMYPNKRTLLTAIVAIYWLCQFFAFPAPVIFTNNAYDQPIYIVLLALYLPTIIVLIGMKISTSFCEILDNISLRWSIKNMEAWQRIMVGNIFIYWYFNQRLTAIFAWIAGPGDIIAGVLSYYAVMRLAVFQEVTSLENEHWSINDIKKKWNSNEIKIDENMIKRLRYNLRIATWFVWFGILDFIAAPASVRIGQMIGTPPEEISNAPLTFVPLFLVPTALVCEVIAMRQLLQLKKLLNQQQQGSGNTSQNDKQDLETGNRD